jgi:hypothetical protein
MNLKFYKEENGNWYVDLPDYIEQGGEKADLQMVSGADTWLESLSDGHSWITLDVSKEPFELANELTLDKTDEGFPELGAYYRCGMYQGVDYSNFMMWLCPVVLFVFEEYPKKIYYK